VYWINVFSGIVFTLAGYFSAPYIGMYFRSIDLPRYIRLVSVSFFILSLSRLFKFLFIKYLKIKYVSLSEIVSYTLSFVLMWVMLYKGYRILAFVYAVIFRSVLQTLILMVQGLKIFVPRPVYRRKSLVELYRYGMFNLGEMITDFLNSQWDTLLIGRLLNLEVLGVYSTAKTLAMKPMQLLSPVISKVNFPLMAQHQDQPEKVKKYYLLSVKYLFAALVVVYFTLIVESRDLLWVLYREKWLEAVPYLRLLSLYFLIRVVRNPLGSLVLATGKVHWRFYWNLVLLVVLPVLIYFASQSGLYAVITALMVWYAAALYISFRLITARIIPVRFGELIRPVIKLCIWMLPSLLAGAGLQYAIPSPYVRIIAIPVVSLALYIWVLKKREPELFGELTRFVGYKK